MKMDDCHQMLVCGLNVIVVSSNHTLTQTVVLAPYMGVTPWWH